MSGLGELDRPATPASPGAWDERSGGWLVSEDTVPSAGAGSDSDGPAVPVAAERPASASGVRPYPAAGPAAPRRGGAVDPVKALMHRHRELCERAVDPL